MVRNVKLALLVLSLLVAAGAIIDATVSARQEVPAEKFYKNIQVFKGVPANRIVGLMAGINTALGVNCDYCHSMDALERADKPAHQTATKMLMMVRDLRDRYKINVECINCHQGKPKPPGIGMTSVGTPGTSTKPADTTTKPTSTGTKPPDTTTKPADTTKPAGGGARPDPPGKVSFAASYGNVPFDHGKHGDATDCAKCHHTNKDVSSELVQKCSACHLKAGGSITKITAKDVAHGARSQRSCMACHVTSHAGPTKCSECHKKG